MNPERREELEAERQFLLRSLADLEREHDAGDVDDADYATLRDGYTARAAATIRELERGAQPPAVTGSRSWGRTVAWIAVVVAIAATAGVLVARSFGERSSGDASPTGGTGDATVTGMLSEARSMVGSDQLQALQLYTQVLEIEPDNVEALTYRTWLVVRAAAGSSDVELQRVEAERSLGEFDRAIALDPTYPDPQCFKAITAFGMLSDAETARPAMDVCLASNPPQDVLALAQTFSDQIDAALASPGSTLPPDTTNP